MTDPTPHIALLLTPGVGRAAMHRIRTAVNTVDVPLAELFALPPRQRLELLPADLGDAAHGLARCDKGHLEAAESLVKDVQRAGGQAIAVGADAYPEVLRRHLGPQAPPVLFARGNIGLLEGDAAAVVGARRVTPAGGALARQCACAFAKAGVTVTSGGADGVDMAGHMGALEGGGATIVVLPRGLLTYTAPATVQQAVNDGRALVLSEFLPDAPWSTQAAVTRNGTIAALSRLACVIEPKKTGGSIRTARLALDMGKRVLFHCPAGPHSLVDTLTQLGAEALPVQSGDLDKNALLRHWHALPREVARQSELFG